MFQHRFDPTIGKRVVFDWFLLSFNGGFINAGGFLATGSFVSHVTGFATLFGVDLTEGKVAAAVGILSVPIFFLAGAFLAGLLIDRRQYRGLRPYFEWVMGLSALCLFASASLGTFFQMAPFGKSEFRDNYLLLILLCLASGLQNAAITASSGKTVRTTHLTGLTTDLGLGLARLITIGFQDPDFKVEARANYLRSGSIFSFILGSSFGAAIFIAFGYRGFVVSALIATYSAWRGYQTDAR